MANFEPLKNRLLLILKENLSLFNVEKRSFLDFGAGSGDVSAFLVDECGAGKGVAVDPSYSLEMKAEALQKRAASARPSITFATDFRSCASTCWSIFRTRKRC
jgi:ubiquinone/menaquinone biosynthesis C-methylase UbiE